MKTKMIIPIVLLLFIIGILTADGNQNETKVLMELFDFSINVNNNIVTIGDNFEVVKEELIKELGDFRGPIEHESNIVGFENDGLQITYINGNPKPKLYSLIITNSKYITSLDISIGDDIKEVRSKYSFPDEHFIHISESKSHFIVQKEFFIDDTNLGDNVASYQGEQSKIYSITFFFENDKITKIILNQAYSM